MRRNSKKTSTTQEQAATNYMLQDGNEHGEDMSKSGTENPQRTQKEESVPEENDFSANDSSSLSTDLERRQAETETTRTGFNVQ